MSSVKGRVAIVVGASTGIGNAIARALAAEGAVVVLASRDATKLARLRSTIEAAGGQALAVPTDVTDEGSVRSLIERTQQECDGLDIVVNSAGIGDWSNQAILDADLTQWRREVETNLVGAMILTQYAARLLSEDGGGDLVHISSGADSSFSDLYPAYTTSKWGLRGFTGSAALALREAGVRVTLLSPGEVATPMQPAEDIAAISMLDPEDIAEVVLFAVTRRKHAWISEIRINPSGFG